MHFTKPLVSFLTFASFTVASPTPEPGVGYPIDAPPSTAALAEVDFCVGTISKRNGIEKRASDCWTYIGCYVDQAYPNRLINNTVTGLYYPKPNSPILCAERCSNFRMKYAGVQWGGECYCDTAFKHPGQIVKSLECNQPCVGNDNQYCGGYYRIQVYARVGNKMMVN